VAEVLQQLAARGFAGTVIAEVSTRRAPDRLTRAADLSEALDFARRHLGDERGSRPPAA